jgi:hypothetical protein
MALLDGLTLEETYSVLMGALDSVVIDRILEEKADHNATSE